MQLIALQAVANQSLVTTQDSNRYQIRFVECNGCMACDIVMNGTQLVTGSRIAMGTPLIPFKYLSNQTGNFIFTGTSLDEVYYTLFNSTQQLYYLSYAELLALVSS